MKLTKLQSIVASVAAVVATLGIGVTAHSASVREQNCISYERQMKGGLTKTSNLLTKAEGMLSMVQENPFAAFGLLGDLLPLKAEVDAAAKQLNDSKYAFVKTCGQDRFNRFVEQPEVKSAVASIDARSTALSN